MSVEFCPDCLGSGWNCSSLNAPMKVCLGCNGQGLIRIADDQTQANSFYEQMVAWDRDDRADELV